MKCQLTLYLLFFFNVYRVFSQDYSYVNYDVKDGLAGSTVYCMVQDKEGFMWFGTETGLSRFDGKRFKNFSTADGLPDNEIVKLFVDSKNRVWIVPFRNSLCYYWKGKIYTEETDSLIRRLRQNSEMISIVENRYGDLMFLEVNAVHILHHTGKLQKIDSVAGHAIRGLKAGLNKDGNFRFSTSDEPGFRIITANIVQDEFKSIEGRPSAGENNYGSFHYTPELEIYPKRGSLRVNHNYSGAAFDLELQESYISSSVVNNSTLALNYVGKTLLFDLTNQKMVDTFSVGQTFNGVVEDLEGNLWFSTMTKGVYRLISSGFENYTFDANNNRSGVFCIQKIDSTLYIGTDRFFLWALDQNYRIINHKQIKHGVSRGRIITLNKINQGLIVGADDGLYAFDHWNLKKFFSVGWKKSDFLSGGRIRYFNGVAIKDIFQGPASEMMVSTSKFALKIDPTRLTLLDTIWRERSTCVFRQNDTNYVGTLDGLYAVDKNSKIIFLGDRIPSLKKRIAAMDSSEDGTIWIATSGDGIVGYRHGEMIKNLKTFNGLTSDICRNIFVDHKDLWIGTDKGLNRISRVDTGYIVTAFTTGDGLKSNIINAVYVDGDEVLLGTPEGLTRFNINEKAKTSSCKFYVTDIFVSGKQMPYGQTNFQVPHKDNNIRFEFAGISYKSAGDIIYKFKLSTDGTWRTTNESSLNYPSLPSGNFTLELAAVNKFGVESNHVIIRFTIEKLLFEKLWFQLTGLLLIIALIFLSLYLRIQNLKKKESQKTMFAAKLSELEQMALRSQMNPHFIFNSLNSIQQYVIDKDILGANEFITQFSRLIRLTLDHSAKLDISLEQEVVYLSTYLELEKKRFENKFNYTINTDPEINTEDYFIPPMILQPYVENSVRHGMRYKKDNEGKIVISFHTDSGYLICNIEDNGIGRKQARQFKSIAPMEYQSKGMTLTARRIEVFNTAHEASIGINIEDMEDYSRNPAGTKVTVRFPMKEAHRPDYIV